MYDIPPEYLDPSRLDDFIAYLWAYIDSPKQRKYIFIYWAMLVGFDWTGYHIGRVTGAPPGTFL